MNDLIFSHVSKTFGGDVAAVDDFSLTIPDPRMTVIVGPSGCGKTTLLRMVAGLESPTSGEIRLGDMRLDTLEPRHRDVAMVFQNYALYPHMSVRDNLSFGLRLRKTPRDVVAARVSDTARTLEIEELLDRKPGQLSGGQRQRVALGRAIIREPRVFLFDEPLSNLDARLRGEMRATIKQLYERLRVTSIYVTHDQVEAMTIGEMLVVMKDGHIHQVGTPTECYRHPADTFVASFLGSPAMNLLEGDVDSAARTVVLGSAGPVAVGDLERLLAPNVAVIAGFRPEDAYPEPQGGDRPVELKGRVVLEEPLGHETLTHVRVGEANLVARGPKNFVRDADGNTSLYIESGRLHWFSKADGSRIESHGGESP